MYLEEYKRWLAADLEDADLNPELARIQVQLRHIEAETEAETEVKTKAGIQEGQGSGMGHW